jgi:7-carboxy-7-deazaguanine synthase
MKLYVSEIMSSLQGEGQFTGLPTTFVRLFGCNLRCSFCDAKYAYDGQGVLETIETIIEVVKGHGNKHVCLTGGEPLIQVGALELVNQLVAEGFQVSIETNGAVQIPKIRGIRSFTYCMDIKCPSSGMEGRNIYENLEMLSPFDEVKFVISDVCDYEFAKDVIVKYPTQARKIFSPVFHGNEHTGNLLAQWIQRDKLEVRLGLQMHKLLGIY